MRTVTLHFGISWSCLKLIVRDLRPSLCIWNSLQTMNLNILAFWSIFYSVPIDNGPWTMDYDLNMTKIKPKPTKTNNRSDPIPDSTCHSGHCASALHGFERFVCFVGIRIRVGARVQFGSQRIEENFGKTETNSKSEGCIHSLPSSKTTCQNCRVKPSWAPSAGIFKGLDCTERNQQTRAPPEDVQVSPVALACFISQRVG